MTEAEEQIKSAALWLHDQLPRDLPIHYNRSELAKGVLRAALTAKEQRAGGGPGAMIGRELLELAAKAAGDPIEAWTADADFVPVAILRSGARWQPLLKNRLTDCMGDALRLAVTLELDVLCASVRSAEDDIEVTIQAGVDPYVATRRAIVRTAAMLAKESK